MLIFGFMNINIFYINNDRKFHRYKSIINCNKFTIMYYYINDSDNIIIEDESAFDIFLPTVFHKTILITRPKYKAFVKPSSVFLTDICDNKHDN